MAPNRDRHLLAIGSDVRLMLAGFGLLLAVGLVSGVGVGVLSSRQLARVPEVDVQQASLGDGVQEARSEEHTSELQSLMRISYAVFCLKKKKIMIYMTCR